MSGQSATPNTHPFKNEIWSRSEKALARKVFDAALKRELQDVMQTAKRMANQIKEPAEVWELESYLTRRRKDIDRKYQFRDSRLKDVLGRLLHEKRLAEEDLQGLSKEKVEKIRSFAQFLAEDVLAPRF